MSYKKHIDRVFQEKLKDFEVAPNPELWKKIQTELNQENETPKRVFPIWLRYASIAALLAILITIGSFVFNGSNAALTPNQNTVDSHPNSSSDIITIEKENNSPKTIINNEEGESDSNIVSTEENTLPSNSNNNANVNNASEVITKLDNVSKSEIANSSNNKLNKNSTSEIIKNNLDNTPKSQVAENQNNTTTSINNDVIADNSEKKSYTNQTVINNQPKPNLNETSISKTTNNIADNNTIKNSSNSNSSNNNSNRNNVGAASIIKNSFGNTPESQIADNRNNTNTSINNDVIGGSSEKKTNTDQSTVNSQPKSNLNETNISKTTNSVADNTTKSSSNSTINSNNNVSSYPDVNNSVTESKSNPELDKNAVNNTLGKEKTQDAVALNAMKSDTPHNEKEENQKVGDSLVSESPSIEEAIAQAEEISEKEEEKLVDRWQAYVSIAPVYYNSLGKGSHIDEQFVSNSKTGEVNTSYGVKVSYALNKKLSIRSGINKLKLSYDTDNVILYEITDGGNGNPVNSLQNINLAPGSESLNAFSAENLGVQQINSSLFSAAISQRLSYYEVPVELEYNIVNNRFSVNIIGGISTFFLDGNEVYSEFEEYTTYIGEANNVNSVSFSTNLGIGLNYKFTEKFRFNLEPTFKYQLNGFENTSGNFRPYIIGVYTGFSYKF